MSLSCGQRFAEAAALNGRAAVAFVVVVTWQ